jgi:hypothetical protein
MILTNQKACTKPDQVAECVENNNMKELRLFTALLVGFLAAGCVAQSTDERKSEAAAEPGAKVARQPVLVELYTSEGCSSCPPAERALKFLAEQQPVHGVEIIPLAFHVDYWDHLGWKDRFSSAAFTKRQELYVQRFGIDSSYTPEMVVDGQSEFIGSDTGRAAKEIGKSLSKQKGTVTVAINGRSVSVSITDLPKHSNATVFLAIVESDLTSSIGGGENAGSTLQEPAVVRELLPVGLIGPDQLSGTFSSNFELQPAYKPDNIRLVAFVQENSNRRIIAVSDNSANVLPPKP